MAVKNPCFASPRARVPNIVVLAAKANAVSSLSDTVRNFFGESAKRGLHLARGQTEWPRYRCKFLERIAMEN